MVETFVASVAVAAFPVVSWFQVGTVPVRPEYATFVAVAAVVAVEADVAVAAFPVIEPEIGFVTVRFVSVPTDVSDEAVTPEASVEPVSVPAAAVTVMSAVPSKAVPLM